MEVGILATSSTCLGILGIGRPWRATNMLYSGSNSGSFRVRDLVLNST